MISDWDDAYDNAGHIGDAEVFPKLWAARAATFEGERLAVGRAKLDCAYGEGPRERLDLFFPDGPPKGLVVFVSTSIQPGKIVAREEISNTLAGEHFCRLDDSSLGIREDYESR